MGQLTAGIRELKSGLSRYVREVKNGATVVITDRGRPVGKMVPIRPSLEERMAQLVDAGLVRWSGKKPKLRPPRVAARGGKSVADILLDNRE